VREALVVLWEAADRIGGQRLKAILPRLLQALEEHGQLARAAAVRERLRAASPATSDRLLASGRGTASTRPKRRHATKPSQQVPIRTFADWNDPQPGSLEIDFVAPCGDSMHGPFLWRFVTPAVCAGWTARVPLLAREQSLGPAGWAVIGRQLPVPIRGIDAANDRAFSHDTLLAYCQQRQRVFTRSRAYQKNDQAWIEQKNGAVVRRFVGDERLSGVVAGQCLAQLVQAVRRYGNDFQPSFKLRSQTREGAQVKKVYHPPATPGERFLAPPAVPNAVQDQRRAEREWLDPLELLHRIREGHAARAALASGELGNGPGRQSLEQFRVKLPQLGRDGEARPTHRREASRPRTWRTRKDPFASVWPALLRWLQEDPAATAKAWLKRLEQQYPGRFPEGQLRTLPRRLREWRRVMARQLVDTCLRGPDGGAKPVVMGANPRLGPETPSEADPGPELAGDDQGGGRLG
jgi:hypothetical protein